MSLFVDTSAVLAALDRDDPGHAPVAAAWREALDNEAYLETTSYVLLETTAVAQRKLGVGAVRTLETIFWPLITVRWIGEEVHRAAVSALLAANRRGLSLVDCVSFEVMRRRGLTRALTLEGDFARQGFETVP